MSRNVEIKARVADILALTARVEAISNGAPVQMFQQDTFFQCAEGRLKLRKLDQHRGELIFYRRADQSGPKESFYLLSTTAEPDSLRECLGHAYGVTGQVTKSRVLYRVNRTRIHLDTVENLGHFMELEVVLSDTDSVQGGQIEADEIMQKLSIEPEHLINVAYVDLLKKVSGR